jgi:hypothetical protein
MENDPNCLLTVDDFRFKKKGNTKTSGKTVPAGKWPQLFVDSRRLQILKKRKYKNIRKNSSSWHWAWHSSAPACSSILAFTTFNSIEESKFG